MNNVVRVQTGCDTRHTNNEFFSTPEDKFTITHSKSNLKGSATNYTH